LKYHVIDGPEEKLGFLKMTIQKFYRINGGSTQIEGVYSDISLPTKYSYMNFGERDLDEALPWDKVDKANYTPTHSYTNFSDVINHSKERVHKNHQFQLINEYAKWLKKNQDDTSYSLNYQEFKKEDANEKNSLKKYKDIFKFNAKRMYTSPKYEMSLIKKDSILAKKRKIWHQNLSKDIYVNEALHVLDELKLKKETALVKN